jgi:nuclear transport factor 2 (NTF2) superfamily protein
MIEDSEIKTTVSPFAIRPGEIKVFDGKDGYVSMNQIIQKINVGHINDLHFRIMEIVNEYEFITSRQLFKLLEKEKFELKSQDKLNNKLEQLVKSKILTRYYFNSEDGKGIYRIYCLEKMGKYLLNSRGVECKWQPTDNTKPVAMIKSQDKLNNKLEQLVKSKILTRYYFNSDEGKGIYRVYCLEKMGCKSSDESFELVSVGKN